MARPNLCDRQQKPRHRRVDDERVDVDVAILDSGVELDHPDLNVVEGVDCTEAAEANEYQCDSSSPGAGDDDISNGDFLHGTLAAERLASIDNGIGGVNGIVGVGVAPGARIWAVDFIDGMFSKVGGPFDEENPWIWDLDASIAAVKWVTGHADQIEVMIGGNVCSFEAPPSNFNYPMCPADPEKVAELNEAIAAAIDAGVVYVMAASNLNRDAASVLTPSHPDVITVSAMADWDGLPGGLGEASPCREGWAADVDDTLSDVSNWGEDVDIAAPACATSGAQPQVAGAAAILASSRDRSEYETPRDYVEEIREILIEEGNKAWVDDGGPEDKGDGIHEPLLDLHDEAVFDPQTVPGDAWLIKPVPHPESTNDNRLTDISCTSLSFCFATGNLISGGSSWGYGRIWDGSTWTSAKGVPENQGVEVTGVSCTSSTSCTAVGHKTEGGAVITYAARWSGGTSWTRQEVPIPPGSTNSRLTGVSCTSTTFCVAVGHLDDGKTWAFGRVWNGSSWTTMGGIPPGDNGGIELNGVSCTSSTSCTAVGHEVESNGVFNFAARWDGTKWARQTTPNSGLGNDNRLTDVSCTSSSFCLATANVVDGEKVNTGYGGVWNGSSWTSAGAAPEAEGTVLNGVSCTSSASCTAVGHRTEGGEVVSYAAHWSGGTSWMREELQSASGATDSRLSGVSCATNCTAVGNYTDGGGVWNLAEHAP